MIAQRVFLIEHSVPALDFRRPSTLSESVRLYPLYRSIIEPIRPFVL